MPQVSARATSTLLCPRKQSLPASDEEQRTRASRLTCPGWERRGETTSIHPPPSTSPRQLRQRRNRREPQRERHTQPREGTRGERRAWRRSCRSCPSWLALVSGVAMCNAAGTFSLLRVGYRLGLSQVQAGTAWLLTQAVWGWLAPPGRGQTPVTSCLSPPPVPLRTPGEPFGPLAFGGR
jgi:hypothetical protein